MKRMWVFCCFVAPVVMAQQPPTATFERRVQPTAEAGVPANLWYFSGDAGGGELVKGAPYSADAITETIQLLSDGNRIVHKNTSKIYRDGEGRKRQEMTINALGPWASGPITMVTIMDPVAKVMWELDTKERTARKIPLGATTVTLSRTAAAAAAAGEFKSASREEAGTVTITTADRGDRRVAGGVAGTVMFAGEMGTMRLPGMGPVMADTVQAEFKSENLGKATMEDVAVTGTRMVSTVPAGAIGNDRAIETIHETWNSVDLQVVVLSKQTDPRMGETSYKLTNIIRGEPSKALFAPPADYTVQEGGGPMVLKRDTAPSTVRRDELQDQ